MSYLLRFPLFLLAIAFVCQFAQGRPIRDSRLQSEQAVWPNWVNGEDAKATPRIQSLLSQFHVIDTALVLQPQGDTLRHVYTFNAWAKRILDLEQKLAGGNWATTGRITNTYDDRNNMLTVANEYWENGHWVKEEQSTYTYDDHSNMLTEVYEVWGWGQTMRERCTYTYDASGNRLSELSERWENGQWVMSWRDTNTDDTKKGIMLSRVATDFEGGHHRWDTYTYDVRGNRLSALSKKWQIGQWVKDRRSTYTYDASRNRLSDLGEEWENGRWVNSYRYAYTYDVMGNLVSVVHHVWDNTSWVPEDMGGLGGFPLIDNAGNEYSFHGWNLTLKYKLIVTDVLAETGEAPERYVLNQNYPNPFNPSTTIEFALPHSGFVTLRVYNVLGEEVATLTAGVHFAGAFKTTWDARGLPSGVYFYRLTAGDYVQTKKMVLVR